MKTAYALFVLLIGHAADAHAASYPISSGTGDAVVGEIQETSASADDTLIDIARRFDVGYEEIVKANPGVNRWLPGAGTRVLIPTRYILPDAPRKGIVLNLAELRLYYYPPAKSGESERVYTYPVSVGRRRRREKLLIHRLFVATIDDLFGLLRHERRLLSLKLRFVCVSLGGVSGIERGNSGRSGGNFQCAFHWRFLLSLGTIPVISMPGEARADMF